MGASQRVRLIGTIRVPTTTGDALQLFTPTGERAWAEGWNPVFPVDPLAGETEPGTTFATDHHGVVTTWIVVRYEPGEVIEYARFTADDRAGLVQVKCLAAADGSTIATVSYDLTALQPDANPGLEAFADHFAPFLAGWQEEIESAVYETQKSGGQSCE